MSSPAQRLSLGPWPGGLALLQRDAQKDSVTDPSILLECGNLDVTDEGYLINRAGCQRVGVVATHYTDATRECRVLGSVFENGSLQAVLGIVVSGTSTKIYLTPDGYTLQFWGTVAEPISSVEQYTDKIYLIRSDTGTPTTGGFTINTNFFTAGVPNAATASTIPSGDKTYVFKDRLFVINKASSTIWFSNVADFANYITADDGSGGGSFVVDPTNDLGTAVFDVVLTNETFYIFKRNATYLFTFDAQPGTDGILRLINAALGGFSATVWENDVYVVNTQGVYRIVNGVFIRLDTQLDLRTNADLANVIDPNSLTRPLFIHAFAGRLLVGQFSGTAALFNFNYVCMNMTNGCWSGYTYQQGTHSAPGGPGSTAQKDGTWGEEIFPSRNRNYFLRIASARGALDYNLDGLSTDSTEKRYFPTFTFRLPPYNAAVSSVWKKLHRFFVRGIWGGKQYMPVVMSYVYDNNVASKDTVNWDYGSYWETIRPQSEFKVSLKQHRFRNLIIKFTCAGGDIFALVGTTYATPPNGSKSEPDFEFYLTGMDLDVSLPRGASSV